VEVDILLGGPHGQRHVMAAVEMGHGKNLRWVAGKPTLGRQGRRAAMPALRDNDSGGRCAP
jgi:hypothetical protein